MDLKNNFSTFYDTGGSIGKRYRRQDEAGTPLGITIDHDTLENNSVTIRNRDTMQQTRVDFDNILNFINDFLELVYYFLGRCPLQKIYQILGIILLIYTCAQLRIYFTFVWKKTLKSKEL